MKILLDTHVLLWTSETPERLSGHTLQLLDDEQNELFFSIISLWEIGVKRALGRADFWFDPRVLRSEALANGWKELPLLGEHVLAIKDLPKLHRDPFDRMLVCQALTEGMSLLTNDSLLFEYPVPIIRS